MLTQPDLNIDVSDISEKAFQRALFCANETIKGGKTRIQWLDYEVPVIINNKSRRDSLDLIGVYVNGPKKGTFIICEVKFAYDDYHSNCPSKAEEELQRYVEGIGDGIELELNQVHHGNALFDWREVSQKYEKWVLANSAYWAYWLGHQNKWSFKKGIYYCYVDIPGNTFLKQEKDSLKYTPQFPEEVASVKTIWPNGDSK